MTLEKLQLPAFLEIRNLLLQLAVLFHHRPLGLVHHAGKAQFRVVHDVTQIRVAGQLVALRQLPQGLRRQRAVKKTGTAHFAPLDQGDFFAEIDGPHHRRKTRGTRAHHTHIKFVHRLTSFTKHQNYL